MKTDRRIDVFPYTRSNAEKAIEQAKKTRSEQIAFEKLMASFQVPGKDFKWDGIGFDLMIETFVEDMVILITNTFPELLPIDWEIQT